MQSIWFKLFFIFLLQQAASVWAEVLPYSSGLKQKLAVALKSQPADYRPRTQYVCNDNLPCYTNRLILENSPYLLQHAHNPIDWYSWSKEALQKAKRENKPIFLSIGYAACHWCHVMEKESFDNLEIAGFINKHFIAIKVDRERRPDIDEFYGNAVMIFKGQKGWPMSVFLTPDGNPFQGGGYYTFSEFKALLLKVSNEWLKDQRSVIQQANEVVDVLQSRKQRQNVKIKIDNKLRKKSIKELLGIVDNYNGGFGEGSKFPREPWMYLLLGDSYSSKGNDSSVALHAALKHMALGGIYDQLGGGFHRYAIDPYWKLPHFEKMLYNQALLIRLYLQANVIQPAPLYTRVVEQSAEYLLTEMRDPDGGFYSAQDADSAGEEGRFYIWHLNEWMKILSKEDAEFAAEIFDIDEYGETENEANVLYYSTSVEEYAEKHQISVNKLQLKLDQIRSKLLKVRNKRSRPARDEKIIMGWNGLIITALSESALHLNKPEYLEAAIKAANFIWMSMRKDMRFYRIHYNGRNSQSAQLDDYAFYLQALISLYDIDKNKLWLDRAEILTDSMLDLFWDKKQGGFFNVPIQVDAPLPIRPRSAFDKTLFSGNSTAAHMLIRLARRTGQDKYQRKADALMSFFAPEVKETPSAFSGLLLASQELREGEKDLPVYAARGHIRVDAYIKPVNDRDYELTVDLEFDDKWHINSNKPLQSHLIPTEIKLPNSSEWQLESIQYPKDEVIKLGFSRESLSLYQGHRQIKARLNTGRINLNPVISLQLQACDDRLCLPPEQRVLYPRLLIKDQ
jgi:uncharacterized protein